MRRRWRKGKVGNAYGGSRVMRDKGMDGEGRVWEVKGMRKGKVRGCGGREREEFANAWVGEGGMGSVWNGCL